jgi:hypothetical protein
MEKTENRFHFRGFISFLTLWEFLILVGTGIVMYIMPHGRIAYWTNWEFLGFTKDGWTGLHVVTAVLFLATIAFHLINNWNTLKCYFVQKKTPGIRLKRELLLSLAVIVVITGGMAAQLPPLWNLMTIEETIKNSWETQESRPPVPHAEKLTVSRIAELRGEDIESIHHYCPNITQINTIG